MIVYDKDESQFGTKTPFKAYQISDEMKQLLKFQIDFKIAPRTAKV